MTFSHPFLLLTILLLPLIAVVAVMAAAARRRRWKQLVANRLSERLIRSSSPLPHWISLGCLLVGTALLILALARPQGAAETLTEKSKGRNVLIALDLSRSMRVADVKPDRLSQAKLIIYELLDALPNERIGLIGFGGEAYLYAPLTVDHGGVRETVEQMDETWPSQGGTDLAAAVEIAVETLHKTGQKQNTLIILSDGEKHGGDTEQMVRMARESGVYILAIGVGTDDGDYVPHPDFPSQRMLANDGSPVISRLQSDVLRRLATGTGGDYAQAGSGANIGALAQRAVAGMDAHELAGRQRKVHDEFYQWFTLPGILLLLVGLIAGTRWRSLHLNTALPLLLLAMSGIACADSPAEQALKSFKAGKYEEAGHLFRNAARDSWSAQRRATLRLAEGSAWYRSQHFDQASAAYSEALREGNGSQRARAHSGMGNSLFELGWRELSEQPYQGSDKQAPDMARFDKLVEKLLASRDEEASDPPVDSSARIEGLITRWTDAVRHYDSALAIAQDAAVSHNREVTMAYLKRLAELLEQDAQRSEEQLSQMLPKPEEKDPPECENPGGQKPDPQSQGKPDPQGDPNQQGKPDPRGKPDQQGKPDQNPQDPGQGQKPPPDQQPRDDGETQGQGQRSESAPKPGETVEEHALRMLKENSDVETGPLSPGRIRFRKPEKDW